MSLSTSGVGLRSDPFVNRSSQTHSAPTPQRFDFSFQPRWVEAISQILTTRRRWGELPPRSVPRGVAVGGPRGSPRAPLSPATGASCPALRLAGTEPCRGVWCVSGKMHRYLHFFSPPRWFLAAAFALCPRLLAAWWWRGEAANGKGPAGIPSPLRAEPQETRAFQLLSAGSRLVSTVVPS